MIIPSAMLGSYAQISKKSQKIMALVRAGVVWEDAMIEHGSDNTWLETSTTSALISLHFETNKSEKMFYVNAFAWAVRDDLDLMASAQPPEANLDYEYLEQLNLQEQIFQESLKTPWGMLFLSVYPWSTKTKLVKMVGSDLFKPEQLHDTSRMKAYLQAMVMHWDEIALLGQRYCTLSGSREFFWNCPTSLQFCLFQLGVPRERVDATLGSVFEVMAGNGKTAVSKSEIQALIDEALESRVRVGTL